MIHVQFNPKELPPDKKVVWEQWEEKARVATRKIIEDWEKWIKDPATKDKAFPAEKFDDRIWKELRDFLLENVFHNKCAYCENYISRTKAHAEHFRPKAQVRFKVMIGNKESYQMGKTTDELGNEIVHPGYFWLAYNWKNLLPSCPACNTLDGKKDQFPLADGKSYVAIKKLAKGERETLRGQLINREGTEDIFYLEPEDLDALEEPQLLHPYFGDDPRKHLIFGVEGNVSPRNESKRGQHSIAVFDLNSEELRIERQRAQIAAWREYGLLLLTVMPSATEERRISKEALAKYIEGKEPYSSAALDFIHHKFKGAVNFDPYLLLEDPDEDQDAG